MTEELIKELCEQLENNLNYEGGRNRINYVSRSINYLNDTNHIAEIFINGECVYAETHMVDNKESDFLSSESVIKENLARRLLSEIFNYGVMSSKKYERKQKS